MGDLIAEVTQTKGVDPIKSNINKKKRINEYEDLVSVIKVAGHLTKDEQILYTKLAELYTEDLRANLFLDQFKLAEHFPGTTYNEWARFLNDRLVSTNLGRHKNTLMTQSAESNLFDPQGSNKRDNFNLLKMLEEKEKNYSDKRIVIMRLPNKYE